MLGQGGRQKKVSQVHQRSISLVHQRVIIYQKVTLCNTFRSNDSAETKSTQNNLITDICNFTNYITSPFCGRDKTLQERTEVGECSVAVLCVVLVAVVVKVGL